MITYPTVVLKCRPYAYNKVLGLGNHVVANLTGNLNVPTPSPDLATVTTALNALQNAKAQWTGTGTGSRGSHADWLALREASLNAHQLLKALGAFVQNTAELTAGNDYLEMAAIIGTTGFDLKATPQPQGPLDAVRNLRKVNSKGLNANQVDWRWSKPLNVTSKGNVKSYIVFRSATGNFDDATAIATVSKGRFVDTNTSSTTVTWSYWIVPVGAAGSGTVSAKMTATLLGTSLL